MTAWNALGAVLPEFKSRFRKHEARAIRRTSSMTDAALREARADSMVASKSFADRPRIGKTQPLGCH